MRSISILSAMLVVLMLSACGDDASGRIKKESLKYAEEQKKQMEAGFPVMTFEKTKHDFGKIKQGDKHETVFKFKNTGESALIITNARSSCGCTIPEYPQEPLQPGEEGEIKVLFNSAGKSGKQNKQVTLTTNTEKGREMFYVLADVSTNEK